MFFFATDETKHLKTKPLTLENDVIEKIIINN